MTKASTATVRPTVQPTVQPKTQATTQAPSAAQPAATPKPAFQPVSDLWVALRDAPSDYSHDEALLLCEGFPGEWVSWVPGYGEITLSRGQFHQIESE